MVGEPWAAPHTHTLDETTVSTVKGMCLTVIDALSVMWKTVGIQIRENDPWERNERWVGEMGRARESEKDERWSL